MDERIERLKEILVYNDYDRSEVEGWEVQLNLAVSQNELYNNPAMQLVWKLIQGDIDAINKSLITDENLSEFERKLMMKHRNFLQRVLNLFKDSEKKIDDINRKVDENVKYLTNQTDDETT